MKFTTIAAMLLVSGATEVEAAKARGWDDDIWSQDSGLAQIVQGAMSRAGPKTITVPKAAEKGKKLTEDGSGGAFEDGRYINTTRKADGQDYLYMWRHQCKFTKWTPTNQYLHNKGQKDFNQNYQDDKITLERFGFVGYDRRCYWGMIGVHWKKPIKIFQFKSSSVQILQEDNRKMCIGFPGKEVDGEKVMQVGKLDQNQADFKLTKVKTGKNKGNYLIEVYSDDKKVLDVQDSAFKAKANMVANAIDDKSTTQVWKLNENEETVISDPTGTWCITRENVIKPSEKLSHKSKSETKSSSTHHTKSGSSTTHSSSSSSKGGSHTTHTITKTTTTHHTLTKVPKKTSKLGLDFGSSFDFLGLNSQTAPPQQYDVVIEKCTQAANQFWVLK